VTVVIGLSGGIATGKSTVARMLEKQGALVICSDQVTRDVQAPGSPALAEIAAAFGPGVIARDGSLDRAALGAIVFRDPAARQRLNDIVHPRVGAEMARRLEAARASGARLVVLDIALLFEGRASGRGHAAQQPFDATVLVYAPREVQIQRQMQRDGHDRGEAERRVNAQLPIEEKRAMADYVIDNSGSLEETERQVSAVVTAVLARETERRSLGC
jgi:dephospho-CoA kinase